MNKEYITPEIVALSMLPDAAVLIVSTEDPVLEDFNVSDGIW